MRPVFDPPFLGPTFRAFAPLFGPVARPSQVIISALVNRALAHQDAPTGFLIGRVLSIRVSDLALDWRFTAAAGGRAVKRATAPADATIRADAAALLLLAGRRADPDTLFFQRRLVIEGDTEIGLQAKNLLDTLEPEDLPRPLARLLDRLSGRIARSR